jgi:hypothetical protein
VAEERFNKKNQQDTPQEAATGKEDRLSESARPSKAPGTKKTENFTRGSKLSTQEGGDFTHDVLLTEKKRQTGSEQRKKKKNTWFTKPLMRELQAAQREVVAQEFFRLFIPNHPKTRLSIDQSGGIFVHSKGVRGFTSLKKLGDNEKIKEDLLTQRYHGLGEITVIALLLNESDLKLDNTGIDEKNKLVKIDGDQCFAHLRRQPGNYTITSEVLDRLPFNHTYEAYNWLGAVKTGMEQLSDYPLDAAMSFNQNIRAEINGAILKALLLPDRFIDVFINHYILNQQDKDTLRDEFKKRREELKQAAYANQDFRHYLASREAEVMMDGYIPYLKDFRMTGKNYLFKESELPEIKEEFGKLREWLSKTAPEVSSTAEVVAALSSAAGAAGTAQPPPRPTAPKPTRKPLPPLPSPSETATLHPTGPAKPGDDTEPPPPPAPLGGSKHE